MSIEQVFGLFEYPIWTPTGPPFDLRREILGTKRLLLVLVRGMWESAWQVSQRMPAFFAKTSPATLIPT